MVLYLLVTFLYAPAFCVHFYHHYYVLRCRRSCHWVYLLRLLLYHAAAHCWLVAATLPAVLLPFAVCCRTPFVHFYVIFCTSFTFTTVRSWLVFLRWPRFTTLITADHLYRLHTATHVTFTFYFALHHDVDYGYYTTIYFTVTPTHWPPFTFWLRLPGAFYGLVRYRFTRCHLPCCRLFLPPCHPPRCWLVWLLRCVWLFTATHCTHLYVLYRSGSRLDYRCPAALLHFVTFVARYVVAVTTFYHLHAVTHFLIRWVTRFYCDFTFTAQLPAFTFSYVLLLRCWFWFYLLRLLRIFLHPLLLLFVLRSTFVLRYWVGSFYHSFYHGRSFPVVGCLLRLVTVDCLVLPVRYVGSFCSFCSPHRLRYLPRCVTVVYVTFTLPMHTVYLRITRWFVVLLFVTITFLRITVGWLLDYTTVGCAHRTFCWLLVRCSWLVLPHCRCYNRDCIHTVFRSLPFWLDCVTYHHHDFTFTTTFWLRYVYSTLLLQFWFVVDFTLPPPPAILHFTHHTLRFTCLTYVTIYVTTTTPLPFVDFTLQVYTRFTRFSCTFCCTFRSLPPRLRLVTAVLITITALVFAHVLVALRYYVRLLHLHLPVFVLPACLRLPLHVLHHPLLRSFYFSTYRDTVTFWFFPFIFWIAVVVLPTGWFAVLPRLHHCLPVTRYPVAAFCLCHRLQLPFPVFTTGFVLDFCIFTTTPTRTFCNFYRTTVTFCRIIFAPFILFCIARLRFAVAFYLLRFAWLLPLHLTGCLHTFCVPPPFLRLRYTFLRSFALRSHVAVALFPLFLCCWSHVRALPDLPRAHVAFVARTRVDGTAGVQRTVFVQFTLHVCTFVAAGCSCVALRSFVVLYRCYVTLFPVVTLPDCCWLCVVVTFPTFGLHTRSDSWLFTVYFTVVPFVLRLRYTVLRYGYTCYTLLRLPTRAFIVINTPPHTFGCTLVLHYTFRLVLVWIRLCSLLRSLLPLRCVPTHLLFLHTTFVPVWFYVRYVAMPVDSVASYTFYRFRSELVVRAHTFSSTWFPPPLLRYVAFLIFVTTCYVGSFYTFYTFYTVFYVHVYILPFTVAFYTTHCLLPVRLRSYFAVAHFYLPFHHVLRLFTTHTRLHTGFYVRCCLLLRFYTVAFYTLHAHAHLFVRFLLRSLVPGLHALRFTRTVTFTLILRCWLLVYRWLRLPRTAYLRHTHTVLPPRLRFTAMRPLHAVLPGYGTTVAFVRSLLPAVWFYVRYVLRCIYVFTAFYVAICLCRRRFFSTTLLPLPRWLPLPFYIWLIPLHLLRFCTLRTTFTHGYFCCCLPTCLCTTAYTDSSLPALVMR